MTQFLLSYYPWIKSLHLISDFAWMAGLLYLPRLFVYHASVPRASNRAMMLGVMEEKLYRIILQPAFHISLITGIMLLAALGNVGSQPWVHVKLTGVFGLILFHFFLNHWRKQFSKGCVVPSPLFFRFVNEIPTLLLVIIVIAVIVKPFS